MNAISRGRWAIVLGLLVSTSAYAQPTWSSDVCAGGVFAECFVNPVHRWGSYGAAAAFDRLGMAVPEHSPLPDGYSEVVQNAGPLGYYFFYPPAGQVLRMKVLVAGGRSGTLEWTHAGDRIRVHLQKGLNRVEVVVAPSQHHQRPKTVHYFLDWTGM